MAGRRSFQLSCLLVLALLFCNLEQAEASHSHSTSRHRHIRSDRFGDDKTKTTHSSQQNSSETKEQKKRPNHYFHYVTRPDIKAPTWNITTYDAESISPGYWFVAPYENPHQQTPGEPWVGPYIYDGSGELIWSGVPLFDTYGVFDFRVQKIGGTDMLTGIYKRENSGFMLDSSYDIEKMVEWPGVFNTSNMHEFTVSEDGSRVLLFTKNWMNVTGDIAQSLGVNRCYIETNGLQEWDVTGSEPKPVFTWNGMEHIRLNESSFDHGPIEYMCQNHMDVFHMNALDRFPDGDLLISARHTDTIYKISRENGTIIWRLGGNYSDFEMLGNSSFSRQHHARVQEQNATHTIISLLDNAHGQDGQKQTFEYSRGLILSLHNGTAEIVSEFVRPDRRHSDSRGSVHIQPNGNAFISWSARSYQSEYASDGRLLMEASLVSGHNTYRGFKFPWVGTPNQPPDLIAGTSKSNKTEEVETAFYMSWNGATQVKTWNIYETNAHGENRTLIASGNRTGFETVVKYNGFALYVVAEAIDANNIPLGCSRVMKSIPPERQTTDWVGEQQWLQEHLQTDTDNGGAAVSGVVYLKATNLLAEALSILQSPSATYIFGVVSGATVLGVFFAVWRRKSVLGRRDPDVAGTEYEPLWDSKEEAESDDTLVEEVTHLFHDKSSD